MLFVSLIIAWRFVNRVEKQMKKFMEVCIMAVVAPVWMVAVVVSGGSCCTVVNGGSWCTVFSFATLSLIIFIYVNLQGFNELIPQNQIKMFDERELEVWSISLLIIPNCFPSSIQFLVKECNNITWTKLFSVVVFLWEATHINFYMFLYSCWCVVLLW